MVIPNSAYGLFQTVEKRYSRLEFFLALLKFFFVKVELLGYRFVEIGDHAVKLVQAFFGDLLMNRTHIALYAHFLDQAFGYHVARENGEIGLCYRKFSDQLARRKNIIAH